MLDQFLFMRPIPGWSNHKTPIDGLYLCGSGVHGGGGVSGAAGRNAATKLLRKWCCKHQKDTVKYGHGCLFRELVQSSAGSTPSLKSLSIVTIEHSARNDP